MRPVAPTTADEESVSEPLSALERRLTLLLVA